MMINGDPKGRIFLSHPHTYDRSLLYIYNISPRTTSCDSVLGRCFEQGLMARASSGQFSQLYWRALSNHKFHTSQISHDEKLVPIPYSVRKNGTDTSRISYQCFIFCEKCARSKILCINNAYSSH